MVDINGQFLNSLSNTHIQRGHECSLSSLELDSHFSLMFVKLLLAFFSGCLLLEGFVPHSAGSSVCPYLFLVCSGHRSENQKAAGKEPCEQEVIPGRICQILIRNGFVYSVRDLISLNLLNLKSLS